MHLSKKDCEIYYLRQTGRGDIYNGTNFQRGYGFFGDLRRYITPLALRAGKYLGNHLLRTGKNVVNDVVEGTSFKDAARSRFRETSKEIKDDFFRKLQHGKGIKRRKRKKNTHSTSKRRKTQTDDIFS